MVLQFKGDISVFSEMQIKYIKNKLLALEYKENEVFFEALGKKGDNYSCTVMRIKVVTSDGADFNVVAKIAPQNDELRKTMYTDTLFRNETIVYTEIFPLYQKLYDDIKLPRSLRLELPQCVGILKHYHDEMILLKDLQYDGYKMLERPMNNESIKEALTSLAKFHSLSFVLNYKNSQLFKELKQKLINVWFFSAINEENKGNFNILENYITSVMDNDKYKKAVTGTVSELEDLIKEVDDLDSRYKVLLHGDCWTNNMLFTMKDTGNINECILIDYQMTREGIPPTDILYLIFFGADYQTASRNFSEWLEHYYNSLKDSLDLFKMDSKKVYPKEIFELDMKKTAKLNLAFCMFLNYLLIKESKNAVDFVKEGEASRGKTKEVGNEMRIVDFKEEELNTFKSKVQEVIDICYQFELI